jgi:hypothetical protein
MARIIRYRLKTPLVLVTASVIGSLLGSAAPAVAAPHSFETFRGPAYITGQFGSMQTTTIPGSPSQGLLMNNGDGTSTLLSPGALPEVVATPR